VLACDPWRVVEPQHMSSTRPLVDSLEEQELLEQLIDTAKPPLEAGPLFRGLDFLLFTPFRYPPLRHGSRFGTRRERGIWYGSEAVRTALAETAYYRLVFVEGTEADLLPLTTALSAFQARVHTAKGVDLAAPPFDRHRGLISSPSRYDISQELGSEMRADGIEAFRYPSARDPEGGANVGLFSPAAFASRRPRAASESWTCTVTASRNVEMVRRDVVDVRRYLFPRSIFLVKGRFPTPAL
jgi:hypothetical protein